MKKVVKTIGIAAVILLIIILSGIIYYIGITSSVKLVDEKLINLDRAITFYDADGNKIIEETNGNSITYVNDMPEHTKKAFVAIEDKRFYSHNGVDYKRLIGAALKNLASFSFKEGASTISQQLIKNTHLSSEKTINRKLLEIKLAKELEKKYSKNEILEKYLNTIYFGDNCYGITSAAKYYFNKEPGELTINESAVLAGIIKAPSRYSPFSDQSKCLKRKNLVIKAMFDQGYITEGEYSECLNGSVNFSSVPDVDNEAEYDYLYLAKKELSQEKEGSPYETLNLQVHTALDSNAQNVLETVLKDVTDNCFKSAILIDKNCYTCAYYSNCGDINRQTGSTIKPLLVYAPAIENDVVSSFTHIVDEKIDFNGYSPSNYNDKYYGKVTVKESLAKSLNSCAVKLLNYTGINKSLEYLKKTDLKFGEGDNSLCIALGASENGAKLSELTSAYTIFINDGKYCSPIAIKKTNYNSQTIKTKKRRFEQIFSSETVGIMNDMLKYTVQNGTAKKLSFLPFSVYAKTGTVGTGQGNTDAYVISYNSEYVLGCWIGNSGDLLPNSVSGGTGPAVIAARIWSELYKNKKQPAEIELSKNLIEEKIDKISYTDDDAIILADVNAPERYVESVIIKKDRVPKIVSTRFSFPKIETPKISYENGKIKVSLCLPEYYRAEIFKEENGIKTLVCDIRHENEWYDEHVSSNTVYKYSVVPYFLSPNGKKFYGEETQSLTIKTPNVEFGEDWWDCDM